MALKRMPISPGFILIFRIKPVKDESTVEAAPFRSVLQPGITKISGAEKQEIWWWRLHSAHLFKSPVRNILYLIYLSALIQLSAAKYDPCCYSQHQHCQHADRHCIASLGAVSRTESKRRSYSFSSSSNSFRLWKSRIDEMIRSRNSDQLFSS